MGSIVVTGVHFDQTTAKTVVDADGSALAWKDIDVGMTVEVEAGVVTTTAERETASSSAIRVTSDLLGPVTAVDGELRVMGQLVRVNAQTLLRKKVAGVWQPMLISEIGVNDIVEVYGFQDVALQRYIATRIERKSPTDVIQHYVVSGVIQDLTTEGCRIGSQNIAYVWATKPASLREGRVARAKLYPVAGVPANWSAMTMSVSEPLVANRTDARIEGLITERMPAPATEFSVNGVTVEPIKACTNCLPGMRAKVRGEMVNGILKNGRVVEVTPP